MTNREALADRAAPARRTRLRPVLIAIGLFGALVALALLSLGIGSRPVAWTEIPLALFAFNGDDPDHIVIGVMRLPRLVAAILVGAALAVAGALMQELTRNPLADPGLLGVNAGASFAVVLTIAVAGAVGPERLVWPAIAGAGVAALCVYGLGTLGRGGPTPVRLTLAGAAVSALLFAIIRGMLLVNQQTLDVYRFWVVGSLSGIRMEAIAPLLPFFGFGLLAAMLGATLLNTLALGDDVARALGTRPGLVRAVNAAAITVLCAAAVTLAGPIGFLGLVVPHMARAVVGVDVKRALPLCAMLGALLLLAADIAGRVVFARSELQAGVMVALVGGPAFIWLVRRTRIMRL